MTTCNNVIILVQLTTKSIDAPQHSAWSESRV